ncbi:MAG: hypothetical protein M3391_02255 [Actinomycetota bacterium]|nr:hypothetical protein [Actinomycetota bacterium]
MADMGVMALETAIKEIQGVLGCVILTHPDGTPAEVQAFIRAGVQRSQIEHAILDQVSGGGLAPLRQVHVFELDAESGFGDRESLNRAAELAEQEARARGPITGASAQAPSDLEALRHRPPLKKVVLTSSTWRSEASVALGEGATEVVGEASGEKTPHGLRVLAQATLDACARLSDELEFDLKGASLVESLGREAVLVLVEVNEPPETLGAALVRGGPVSEAAVRATLDAVNRRLALNV